MDTLEEDGNEPFITCERGDDYVKLLFFNKILYAYYHGFKAEEIVLKRDIEIWVSYEDSHNISAKDYDELWCSNGTYELTDDEAVDLVCGFFGFNKDEVKLYIMSTYMKKGSLLIGSARLAKQSVSQSPTTRQGTMSGSIARTIHMRCTTMSCTSSTVSYVRKKWTRRRLCKLSRKAALPARRAERNMI